jgi:hypothetical protein
MLIGSKPGREKQGKEMKMKTVSLEIKEYDYWDGTIQCVHNDIYPTEWLGSTERTVRNFLAGGDYSEGDDNRTVEVSVVNGDDETYHASYSAPQIRRFRVRAATTK